MPSVGLQRLLGYRDFNFLSSLGHRLAVPVSKLHGLIFRFVLVRLGNFSDPHIAYLSRDGRSNRCDAVAQVETLDAAVVRRNGAGSRMTKAHC